MEFEYVYSNLHIGEIIKEYAFYRVLHVTTVIAAATIVLQRGPFGLAQACIGKEPVGAFFIGVRYQSTVELLRHIDGRLAFARVQDRKGVVAQRPVRRPGRDHGRLTGREEMAAG